MYKRQVYDGAATVTGVTARLAKDAADARRIIGEGEIPILIDPEYKAVSYTHLGIMTSSTMPRSAAL